VLANQTALTTEQQTGLGIGMCFLWAIQNLLRTDQQGWFNNMAAVYQLGAMLLVIIVLFVSCPLSGVPLASANDIFFTYYNQTGIDDFGYVICIGLLTST